MSYNANIPQSTDFISQSQSQILANFGQLNTQFSIDHIALTAGSANGQHKQITLNTYGATPYTNTGTQSYVYSRGVANGASTRSCLEYQASQSAANLLPISPKAMVRFDTTGAILGGYSFNVSSVSAAAPIYTINFSEALANTNYFVFYSYEGSTTARTMAIGTKNTASVQIGISSITSVTAINVMVY